MQAKSLVECWRAGFIGILIITMLISNLGCNKKEETKKDEYYVKYEVNSSTIYYGGKLNVVISKENNLKSTILVNTREPWEAIVGPVTKGFAATLNVNEVGNNYGHLKLYTQISVSKNSSPFALKQVNSSDIPRTSVQNNYTIDY